MTRSLWALIPIAGLALFFVGCSTAILLTPAGQRVNAVDDAERPASCRLIRDIPIGIPPDGAQPPTEEEMVFLMRNKAGEENATHLVVDYRELQNPDGNRPYWTGRGRAYRCEEEDGSPFDSPDPSEEGPADEASVEASEEDLPI
ncbi:MAG: hypothetical protein AAGF12_37810 [Myxococcota bacterium]